MLLDPSHTKETVTPCNQSNMPEVTGIDGNTPHSFPIKQTNIANASNVLHEPIVSTPITVPYLSPLVLRKELENMLEREGDTCLVDPSIGTKIYLVNILCYHKTLNNQNTAYDIW